MEIILKRYPAFEYDPDQLWTTLRAWWAKIGRHAWALWESNRRLFNHPLRAVQALFSPQWLRKDYDQRVLPRLADLDRKKIEIAAAEQTAAREREEREAMERVRMQEQADLFDREVWCPQRPEVAELKRAAERLANRKPVVDVVTIYPSGPIGLEAQRPREVLEHPSIRERLRDSRLAAAFSRLLGAGAAAHEEADQNAKQNVAKIQRHALTRTS
jgi:hypothetical protein